MAAPAGKLNIKRQLEDARREIGQNASLRDEAYIEPTADAMDQVQAAEARELAIRTIGRTARRLRQIQGALRRLDVGGYGTCVNCESKISAKRLRAVPWTQLCLKCQNVADQCGSADHGGDTSGTFVNAAHVQKSREMRA